MADLAHGNITLLLAVALAAYAGVGSLVGQWRHSPDMVLSARYAAYLTPLMLIASMLVLIAAFVDHDFSLRYVAGHSNRAMDPWLTWVAFYAGNEGSLLFLAAIFSGAAALAIRLAPDEVRPALPFTTAVLMGVTLFFVAVMMTMANPFFELPITPPDGQGINPLLTHPGMFFHPPMLMSGLIGVGLPFAFAIGHLLAGQTGDEWVDTARTWGLIVWVTLTIGLLLGAWWAYTILGWGGYWAWDPVENAGLLPWLPLTAFIHSIMVQRRRGMFRMWNIVLIILAWGLAMYGMFMNRGGPVPSVHSFGQSTMGWVFLIFLGVNLIGAFAVFFWRYNRLRSAAPLESRLSREAAFLLNNLLFLMIALVTLWGVVYPLVTDVFQGVTVTVGRPYFDIIAGPAIPCAGGADGSRAAAALEEGVRQRAFAPHALPHHRGGDRGRAGRRIGRAIAAARSGIRRVRHRRGGHPARVGQGRARAPRPGRELLHRLHPTCRVQPAALRRLHRAPRHRAGRLCRDGLVLL